VSARQISTLKVQNTQLIYFKVLHWLQQCGTFCFLDNRNYLSPHHKFEWIAAAGNITCKKNTCATVWQDLNEVLKQKDWVFGHISYDCKNAVENLTSSKPEKIGFEDYTFFIPETVIYLQHQTIVIETHSEQPTELWEQINQQPDSISNIPYQIKFTASLNQQQYINNINKVLNHIQKGNCYELNYCMEFFAENCTIDPLQAYYNLVQKSPNPFCAFYKIQNSYCISASPERYLQKQGTTLLSQPIKGTIKRNLNNPEADEKLKTTLQQNPKERSENVMVVDLVRNDFSKFCKKGTVHASELFEVYSFPQVHHLISTITGELDPNIPIEEIIKATFPMGSMTGAPKKRVMELIEALEPSRRGIFSGTIGYITPQQNMDWNVVIRSAMYNANSGYLSYQVGSGITAYSNPEQEYEECLLKASAIEAVF
jgi:para-aminobenzoate synthetase component I